MSGRGKGPPPISSAILELESNTNEVFKFGLDKDTSNEDIKEMIDLIENNKDIKKLRIDSGGGSERSVNLSFNFERIYEALKKNMSITSISFISTNLRDEMMDTLVEIVKRNPYLERLYLQKEYFDIIPLCEAILVNNSLKELILPECGLGGDEVEAISSMLSHNNSLQVLNLEKGFRDESLFPELLEGLQKNDSLRNINLQYNALDDNDIKKIGELLKTKKWRSLSLYLGCSDSSTYLIAEALKENVHLEELILEEARDECFLDCLKFNNTLKKVYIPVNQKNFLSFCEIIQFNHSLVDICHESSFEEVNFLLGVNKKLSQKPCWSVDRHSFFENEFDEILLTFLLLQNSFVKDKPYLKIPKPLFSRIFDQVAIYFLIQLKLNFKMERIVNNKRKRVDSEDEGEYYWQKI